MRKRRWKAGEISVLSWRYEAEGPAQLAVELGRSVHSVTSQASRLGMKSANRRNRQANSRRRPQAASSRTGSQLYNHRLQPATGWLHDPPRPKKE